MRSVMTVLSQYQFTRTRSEKIFTHAVCIQMGRSWLLRRYHTASIENKQVACINMYDSSTF